MDDTSINLLLRGIAHDLSSLTRASTGFTQILLDDDENPLNEQTVKWLRLINDEGARAQTILSRLFVYARLFDRSPTISRCNLNDLCSEAIKESALLSAAIDEQRLVVDIDTLPKVNGVADLWPMYFTELLENAVLHNEDAVVCRIRFEHNMLSVSDNGQGIDASMMDRALEPLKKLSASSRAGLGLSICNRIAELNQTKMILVSSESEGLKVSYGPMKALD